MATAVVGYRLTWHHPFRLTALHLAVQNNLLASLQAFVMNPDLTHLPDMEGRTPLMTAAGNGYAKAVEVSAHLGCMS